ncbi:MAG: T9SS type A sorting domain-containing protein, partial [Saprospiraceae bacterium]
QTVKEPKELIASVKVTNILCFGQNNGKIDGKASGGTGTKTFLWNTGATTPTIASLAPGTYTFTVTDANGCTSSALGTVTQPASALSFTGFNTNPVGSNFTVTVTGAGGVAPRKFRRETAPGSGIWSGYSGTGIFTNVPAGTYLFEISDKNKCTLVTSQAIPVPVAKPQGNDRGNQDLAQDFTLTPNPARGSVQLAFIGEVPTTGDVEVRDASGRLLQFTSLAALNSNRLSLEGLPTGVLFVTYRAEGVTPVTKRLVAID